MVSATTGSFYIAAFITCAKFSWHFFENRLTKILKQILEFSKNKNRIDAVVKNFLENNGEYSMIHIRVTPNAAKTKIIGKINDEKDQEYLKIHLAALPEDGKANKELIKFLAELLKIPKSKIEIIRGEISRTKMVKVTEPTIRIII